MGHAPRDVGDLRRRRRHPRRLRLRPRERFAVPDQQPLDRRHLEPLPPRHRRDLVAAARAVRLHHGAVRHLLVEPLPGAAQPEGIPRARVDPRGRHERHVRRAGSHPLLRVLRDRAAPDVLHDRRLGRPEPAVRVDQVLPVHAVRLGPDAAELPCAVLPGRHADRPHLRHGGALERRRRRHHPRRAAADLRGPVPRLRDQGSDVPVPHMAAGRAHRGADRGLGPAGGHPPEARDLRFRPHRAADVARGRQELGAVDRPTRRHRHHLRRVGLSTRRPT